MADTVTLIAPDGREHVARDPAEVNNLVYGAGYRHKPEPEPEPEPENSRGRRGTRRTSADSTDEAE